MFYCTKTLDSQKFFDRAQNTEGKRESKDMILLKKNKMAAVVWQIRKLQLCVGQASNILINQMSNL